MAGVPQAAPCGPYFDLTELSLGEGVLKPDLYDPVLNPLYRDLLAHYGAVALPCPSATQIEKARWSVVWGTPKAPP
jgi:hypothetical protein